MKPEYKLLLTASLVANFADNLIGPLYAVFVQRIGGSILDVGYTMALYSIAAGILVILMGKLSDKINKGAVTVVGYLLFALGTFGYLLIHNSWQLFLLQIIFAIGTACLSAPLQTLFAQYIHRDSSGLQWGLSSGGSQITVGVSVLCGALLTNYYGFRVLFVVMGSIQLIAMLVQLKLFIMTRPHLDHDLF